MFFAAAGAGDYPKGRFLAIVAACRAARYFTIAFVAGHYGRHFLRVLRHPTQHWEWFVVALLLTVALFVAGMLASRRLERADGDRAKTGVQSPAV
jgi:membrane protein DedA with SNARE-associated domain